MIYISDLKSDIRFVRGANTASHGKFVLIKNGYLEDHDVSHKSFRLGQVL